jgi:hypothetical protein
VLVALFSSWQYNTFTLTTRGKQMITKQELITLLATNDRAVERAVMVLFERQTADEQNLETTREKNGVGFTGVDGEIGCSMAKFYLRNRYLTPKQIAWWRKPNKNGVMRIAKYHAQLLAAAAQKARAMTARMTAELETA